MESQDIAAGELDLFLSLTVGDFLGLQHIGLSPHETVLAMMRDHTADEMLISMAADHIGIDAYDGWGRPRESALTASRAKALERIDTMLDLLDNGQVSLETIDENFDTKALCAIKLIEIEEGLGGHSQERQA